MWWVQPEYFLGNSTGIISIVHYHSFSLHITHHKYKGLLTRLGHGGKRVPFLSQMKRQDSTPLLLRSGFSVIDGSFQTTLGEKGKQERNMY